jgi:hypothetical protein
VKISFLIFKNLNYKIKDENKIIKIYGYVKSRLSQTTGNAK